MSRIALSLLLLLLLPIQGYAAMPDCGAVRAAAQTPHHCGHTAAATHHHKCGTCCATAIAPAYVHWVAALRSPALTLPTVLSPPPIVLPDRLDRPPRSRPV